MKRWTAVWAAALAAMVCLSPHVASARPNYFATFTSLYGLTMGQDLYACGVCHRRWEGTGARNPFGVAVEQQLYIGKSISQAILDVAGDDTDGDGFTNGDEISIWGTLPGYSCATYGLAIDPPLNFQSLITPGVPSCLEPKDVLVDPTLTVTTAELGKVSHTLVNIVNNGTADPITVSNYTMLLGSAPSFAVSGPTLPIVIPVGGSAVLDLSFTPTATGLVTGTLRISSDDPDEPDIDFPATGIGFVKNLAPAADRVACRGEAEKRLEIFSKTHFKEWSRCYLDELHGFACDTGRRDLKLAQAEDKFRSFIGGAKDRQCVGKGLTPARLDLPPQCGAPCESIVLNSIGAWADCLVCRQEAADDTLLQSTIGVVPPDLPPAVLAADPLTCNRKVSQAMQKSVKRIHKDLGACALGNVGVAVPTDCAATLATSIDAEAARVDAAFDRCSSSTGMLSCRQLPMPDPQCLGTAAKAIPSDLVDAVFDTAE